MCGRSDVLVRIPSVLAAIHPAASPAKTTTKNSRTTPPACHCQTAVAARAIPPMKANVASHHPTGAGGMLSVSGLSVYETPMAASRAAPVIPRARTIRGPLRMERSCGCRTAAARLRVECKRFAMASAQVLNEGPVPGRVARIIDRTSTRGSLPYALVITEL